MADGAIIGALRVVLGADTAQFDTGMKNSQSALANFAKQVTTIASGIALEKAIERSVGALVHSIKQGIIEADKLNKLSQSIGIPVDELSKLKHAADLSDVSLESLGKSTVKLSKAMIDVAGGGTGPAKQAFDALGISVKNTDGTMRSTSEVLADTAEKFAGYRDGAGKTALAVALFGKAGAEMIPLLNMGRDGLKEAGDEAAQLGLVLDKNTTQAAENFNDNLTRLGKVKDGIITQITARMLPALELFSSQMVQSAKDADFLQKSADGITSGLKFIAAEIVQTVTFFQRLGAEAKALWDVLKAPDWASLKTAWAAFNAEGAKSEEVFRGVKQTVANIWSDVPTWESQAMGIASMNKQVMLLGAEWTKTAAPIIASGEASKNALQSFLDSQAKRTAAQTAEAESIGLGVGALERLKIAKQADEILDQNKIARTPAVLASIAAAGDAAAAAALKVEAARVTQMVMSPAEKYAQDLAQLQVVYESTNMSMETFQARQQQIAEAAGATWAQAGESIAGSFADIATSFGKESKGMAVAAKVFGVIQGTISMFTGAAKALELPFPANIAAVAAVLAKGASLVASIKGQNVPSGYAMGGAFRVPGGIGGGDRVPFNAMLEPGELVEISSNRPDGYRSGGDRSGSRSSGGVYELRIDAILRPFAEMLMPHMEAANRDGHTLKLVNV